MALSDCFETLSEPDSATSPIAPLSSATMSPAQTHDQMDSDHVGPHRSYIQLARQFMSEAKLQEELKATGVPETKEDTMRLQGVTWIDNVRKALKLPVRTFDTAVTYYHKFRLAQAEGDYGFIDAVAAAALFTACKIEDTQKRSRDILCAAHNLKVSAPSEQLTQDDPRFESQSKTVIALERVMLESSAFDFRSTSPQKLVIKLARAHKVNKDTVGKTAYLMCLDLYRTFAPLKQTSQTLAMACVELAGRLHGENVKALEEGRGYRRWHTSREEVMETIQDLLELYIQHGSKGGALVAQGRPVEDFIAIRIPLNQEATKENLPRYVVPYTPIKQQTNGLSSRSATNGRVSSSKPSPMSPGDPLKTPGTGESPSTPRREREARAQGTVRFMLDGESAQAEKNLVDQYFKVEIEEIEIEEEVEVSKLRQERDREEREKRESERERNPTGPAFGPRARPWERGYDRPPRDRPRDRDREREGDRFRDSRYDREGDRDRESDRFRDTRYDREHDRDRRRL